jgi:hypothetical protein
MTLLADIDWRGMAAFVAAIGSVLATVLGIINRLNIKLTQANVQKVETATNSMKDALVKATAASSFAEGHKQATDEAAAQRAAVTNAIADAKSTGS